MPYKAGLNIEDHIGIALYSDNTDLLAMLQESGRVIMAETLSDNLLLATDPNEKPSFTETYREAISPTSVKKLESYTVEVVLGKM